MKYLSSNFHLFRAAYLPNFPGPQMGHNFKDGGVVGRVPVIDSSVWDWGREHGELQERETQFQDVGLLSRDFYVVLTLNISNT